MDGLNPNPAPAGHLAGITNFLYREARLLDEQRWEEWLDLFTDDGMYWVPLVRGQTDYRNHASLFCEDALLRRMRARRLVHERAFSQQPATRTTHLVGNVELEAAGEGAEFVVHSSFHLLEARKWEQRMFGGTCRHTLVATAGDFRIRMKRVDLINCDAAHEALQVFI